MAARSSPCRSKQRTRVNSGKRDAVDDLIVEGRLDRVATDTAAVQRMLRQASLNLEGARRELEAGNPAGAYALLWDSVRQAIGAHMLANGLRATSRPGHHAAVITYAETRLISVAGLDELAALDRMRRTRNRTEYGAAPLAVANVQADLQIARRLLQALLHSMQPGG
jgi:hypothetical protein